MIRRFNEAHDFRYGHSNPGAPVEFVALRAAALGDLGHAEPEELLRRRERGAAAARATSLFDGAEHATGDRRARRARRRQQRSTGPLIVEEATATTVVPPGCTLAVDRFGSLIITIGKESRDGHDHRRRPRSTRSRPR